MEEQLKNIRVVAAIIKAVNENGESFFFSQLSVDMVNSKAVGNSREGR